MTSTRSRQSPTKSANDCWRERVAAFSNRPAFHYSRQGQWVTMTWSEADQAAKEIAGGLVAMGLSPGDTVAIHSQTRLEWVLLDIAAAMLGVVTVPIYPSSPPSDCGFILTDTQAKVLFIEEESHRTKLEAAFPQGWPGTVITFDPGDGEAGSLAGLRARGTTLLGHSPHAVEALTETVGASSLFTIIYTSGTTGQPKGVELTHGNLVASCESAIRAFDLRPEDVQYLFLPLAHVLGREVTWAPIMVGAEIALTTGLPRIKFDLTEIRPTFMAGVPRIFEKLHAAILANVQNGSFLKRWLVGWAFQQGARHSAALRARGRLSPVGRWWHALANRLVLAKLRRRLGLDRCRFLISGGAALSPEIATFFHGLGLLILEGYGLTETTAAAFVNRINDYRLGTVGRAIDVMEYRLAEDGEILLRGPSVFSRYHGNPQATGEVFDEEGWFHTGDIGILHDGFLQIVDRKKDILVPTNGKNISPQKLENLLKAHSPYIGQAVVFGDNRPHCVVLVTPSEVAVKDLGQGDLARAAAAEPLRQAVAHTIATINQGLPRYEQIKEFAIVPSEFTEATGELTPSLKVKRGVVFERFKETIDRLYAK